MLQRNLSPGLYVATRTIHRTNAGIEGAIVARFVARATALGPLVQASPNLQARLLQEVKAVALRINASTEVGVPSGYGRHVLYEDPDRWSLAAIILRPGQRTELHDHASWGCAVTVQGIERDRRFVHDAEGNPILSGERDYLPGTGYVFDHIAVHQPVGADPSRVTVALHFLAHDIRRNNSHREIVTLSRPSIEDAA